VVVGLLLTAKAATANPCTWSGHASPDNGWRNAANWDTCGGTFPQNMDDVIFPVGAAQPTNVNNIPGLTVTQVVFHGPGLGPGGVPEQWHITGNGVTVRFRVVSFSGPDAAGRGPSFLVDIAVGSAPGFGVSTIEHTPHDGTTTLRLGNIDLNGHPLQILNDSPIDVTGHITGSVPIQSTAIALDGTSSVTFGDNSYTGSTIVSTGTLIATTAHSLGASGSSDDRTNISAGTLMLADGVVFDEQIVMSAAGALRVATGKTATLAGRLFEDITLTGGGTLVLANPANVVSSLTVTAGTVRVGAAGALGSTTPITLAPGADAATLDLNNIDLTIGALTGGVNSRILLGSHTLTLMSTNVASTVYQGTIAGTGNVVKTGPGNLDFAGPQANTYTGTTTVQAGILGLAKTTINATVLGPIVITGGELQVDAPGAGQIADGATVTVHAPGQFHLDSGFETIGSLTGDGQVRVGQGTLSIGANNTSTTFTGTIAGDPAPGGQAAEKYFRVIKVGTGQLSLTSADNRLADQLVVDAGTLVLDGTVNGSGVLVRGGTLAGTGTMLDTNGVNTFVSNLIVRGGLVSPGHSPGVLHADAADLAQGGSLVVQVNGAAPGTGYDQLDLTHGLTLGADAQLVVTRGFDPARDATFTIVNVAPGQAIGGTFAGLPEGATLTVDRQTFTITYRGGPAQNSIVLTATSEAPPPIYYLSEGATGGFFDEDVLLANPNDTAAPVTLTFSKEDGTQVVATRTVPAQARLTVHVDQIPGLESTAVSAQVQSDAHLPLVVERSMFWDASYYAGHTGTAVDTPEADWFFAEGSQGFFNTFVLVINPNATPTDVTFTFFREQEPAVVKTITVGATTRLTLFAGDVPDLVDRSFGIAVHATQPIMAERSMYFGTRPDGQLSGGTESAGVTSLSTHWFMAEGATGGFYDTFILLSNPQETEAHVQLQYLLPSGETITVPKTIAAHARLTTNIEAEDDPRLQNAAVSTVVTSDQPIIAERSMYWPGAATPWGEGHNSFGVVDAGTKWGLSEGRTGGPHNFHTYILLANPQTTAAEVTVSYLRETGEPVTKTYTVPPTSRFNIDVGAVTELHDESFAAVVQVTNGVPIIVERSMYWDANGIQFSGGTNATGIRLP
jgi:autotransporter-associated beta strand protein